MMRPLCVLMATVAMLTAAAAAAQPVMRIKGRVVSDRGEPIEGAQVRMEAVYGFGAREYVGQRTYTVRTNAKGEWSVVGLQSGAWVFDVSAPGRLPEMIALPINLATPIGYGASGQLLTWQLILKPMAVQDTEVGRLLGAAADAARAGTIDRVRVRIDELPGDADGEALATAGRIALIVRDLDAARALFVRALDRDAASFRAAIGVASAALMLRDFEAAARAYAAARDRTKDKDEQKYLSAAIGDLIKVVPSSR